MPAAELALVGRADGRAPFGDLSAGAPAAEWRAALAGTREAAELDDLLRPRLDAHLLHLDLHCLNALRGASRWQAIDPKPHLGDPHAEVFGFLYGPPVRRIPHDAAAAKRYEEGLTRTCADAAGQGRRGTLAQDTSRSIRGRIHPATL